MLNNYVFSSYHDWYFINFNIRKQRHMIHAFHSTVTVDFEDLDFVDDIALSAGSTKGQRQNQSNITPQKRVFYYEGKKNLMKTKVSFNSLH